MKNRITAPLIGTALALLIFTEGFAKVSPPEFVAPDFDAQKIEEIVVLSMLDHRVDTEKEVRLNKWIKKIVEISLKKKRFKSSIDISPEFVAAVSRDGLEDEDPEMISRLGPADSRWLLLLVLHDASSKMSLGSSGGAEVTGYILDKENQSVIWRNKVLAEARQGGLMGMAMKGAMKITAIQMAVGEILQSLPKRAKTK